MKNIIIYITFVISSCTNVNLEENIIGTWINEVDSSKIVFNENGLFEVININNKYFFPLDTFNIACSGFGVWRIIEGQTGIEIDVFFKNTNCNHSGYKMSLYLDREGIIDNGEILCIYLWKDEEGGERYNFKRGNAR